MIYIFFYIFIFYITLGQGTRVYSVIVRDFLFLIPVSLFIIFIYL